MPREAAKLTPARAKALMKKHGSYRAAAQAAGSSPATVRKWYSRALEADNPTPPSAPTEPVPSISELGEGFSLDGRDVLARRPADIWSARFRALPAGRGYRVKALGDHWRTSANNVKKQAKDHNALRYVEIDGEYVALVVNPAATE